MVTSLFDQLCEISGKRTAEFLANKDNLASYISHTTIGVFRLGDGSIIAFSDGQVTSNMMIVARNYSKVLRISDHALFLISGVPKLAKDMARIMKITLDNYSKIYGRRLTVRAEVNHIETLLVRNFHLVSQGLLVLPILVTYDENKDKVRIFSFSADGSSVSFENYKIGGSGESAWGYMEARWKPGLTEEEGISLADEYLDVVYAKDAGSGGVRNIYRVSREGISKIRGDGQ